MAEETQRQATPHEALNAVDQWLSKLSGPGIDRNAHIQMQAAIKIIGEALPSENDETPAEPQP
jgi:hypothetical protein